MFEAQFVMTVHSGSYAHRVMLRVHNGTLGITLELLCKYSLVEVNVLFEFRWNWLGLGEDGGHLVGVWEELRWI